MDVTRLRYFLEVVRQKSFSEAAQVCHVSQPSLSQQIKKLEDEVGGLLFVRGRGAVSLSELGQTFLKYAQAIMAEVDSAEEFVVRAQKKFRSIVRFGAIPTVAPYLIPQVFAHIRARHPEITFELTEGLTADLEQALENGAIDFALLSPPLRLEDDCEQFPLLRDELLLTLAPTHALCADNAPLRQQLEGENIILLEKAHCLAHQTAAFCDEAGLDANIAMTGSQIDTLLGIVELDFGITFTPRVALPYHRHRQVVYRSFPGEPVFREISLVWLRRRVLSRSQEMVLACMTSLREALAAAASSR